MAKRAGRIKHEYRYTFCCTENQYKTLRMLAIKKDCFANELVNEALNDYFKKHDILWS